MKKPNASKIATQLDEIVTELLPLGGELLDVVFAEVAQDGVVGFAERGGRQANVVPIRRRERDVTIVHANRRHAPSAEVEQRVAGATPLKGHGDLADGAVGRRRRAGLAPAGLHLRAAPRLAQADRFRKDETCRQANDAASKLTAAPRFAEARLPWPRLRA